MKLTRRSDQSVGIGFLYKGPLQDIPSWLQRFVELGKVKPVTATSPMEVQAITGRFWPVFPNDWIIAHGNDLYRIADEDIGHSQEGVM